MSVEDCIRAGRKDRKLNEREKNVMRVALKKFQGGGLELTKLVASRVASTGVAPALAGSKSKTGLPLIVDVSQSETFERSGLGQVPTYARSSRMGILQPGQSVRDAYLLDTATALELHGFPKSLCWGSISSTAQRQMVGNSQHVRAAAASLLMAMSLASPDIARSKACPAIFSRVKPLRFQFRGPGI